MEKFTNLNIYFVANSKPYIL